MFTLRHLVLLTGLGMAATGLAAAGFLESLASEERKRLGLDQLTTQQQAGLEAAVEAYRRTAETAATQVAAASAVAEYRQKEEPAVVSRAVDEAKRQAGAPPERITATIMGKFNGWSGGTLFTLDNGQVWRQSRPGTYYIRTRENAAVVLYKGPGGYWRLRILDDEGAWVTVTRVK